MKEIIIILCTPNDRRSGFFSKTFHWWFVCCVPPLIGPKRVVKSGGPSSRQLPPLFFENLHFEKFKTTNFVNKRRTRSSRIRSFSAAAQRTFRACSRDEAAHAVACAAEASGARSIRTQRWRLPRLRPVHDSGRKPQPGGPGMRPPPNRVPF